MRVTTWDEFVKERVSEDLCYKDADCTKADKFPYACDQMCWNKCYRKRLAQDIDRLMGGHKSKRGCP